MAGIFNFGDPKGKPVIGSPTPIYVNSLSDPRYKAYQDSSMVYNLDKKWENLLKSIPNNIYTVSQLENIVKPFNLNTPQYRSFVIKDKNGYPLKPDFAKEIKTTDNNAMSFYSNVYKKPTTPVYVNKPSYVTNTNSAAYNAYTTNNNLNNRGVSAFLDKIPPAQLNELKPSPTPIPLMSGSPYTYTNFSGATHRSAYNNSSSNPGNFHHMTMPDGKVITLNDQEYNDYVVNKKQ